MLAGMASARRLSVGIANEGILQFLEGGLLHHLGVLQPLDQLQLLHFHFLH